VTLVPYGGKGLVIGFNNLVDGWVGDGPLPDYRPNLEAAMERAEHRGFKSGTPPPAPPATTDKK
jgi:urease subunit beta